MAIIFESCVMNVQATSAAGDAAGDYVPGSKGGVSQRQNKNRNLSLLLLSRAVGLLLSSFVLEQLYSLFYPVAFVRFVASLFRLFVLLLLLLRLLCFGPLLCRSVDR